MAESIEIDTARLEALANSLKQSAAQVLSKIHRLESQMNVAASQWSGAAAEAYVNRQRSVIEKYAAHAQRLERIAAVLTAIGSNYEKGENDLKARWS